MKTVNPHAYNQTIKRFAIMPKEANKWINDRLEESTFIDAQEDGRRRYMHPDLPIFIVTCPEEKVIITVIDKKQEAVSVESAFLMASMPVFEREYERMKKSYRVQKRELETQVAEAVTTMGLTLKKRVRVYNPSTQALLQAQADDVAERIEALQERLATLKKEYELASIKMRAFIRTASGEKR